MYNLIFKTYNRNRRLFVLLLCTNTCNIDYLDYLLQKGYKSAANGEEFRW